MLEPGAIDHPHGPGAREDRLAMVAGVLLSTVGLATFLLMPTFVEAVVTDLHYTERQVGIVSAVVSLGNMLASLVAPLWIRRHSWRMVAAVTVGGRSPATRRRCSSTRWSPSSCCRASSACAAGRCIRCR